MELTFTEHDFYEECRRRNKEKFISIASKNIEEEQKKDGGVNIPHFLEAQSAYDEFEKCGFFDEYGRLKPLPKA
jgi:hypothetical protein